jgi:hypothetical protein
MVVAGTDVTLPATTILLGFRGWLFALGARASANVFSLPAANTVEALDALLPWNVKS